MEGVKNKSDNSAKRSRVINLNPLELFKTNKKSVSLGLVMIGAFALLSTVLSVNLSQKESGDSEVKNENAKSSYDPVV